MLPIEFLGLIAGGLTTIAFIPQVYKTRKTKSARDVSLHMFVLFITGVTLWIVYGIVNNVPSVLFSNIAIFILAAIQILLKIKYDKVNIISKEKKIHEKI